MRLTTRYSNRFHYIDRRGFSCAAQAAAPGRPRPLLFGLDYFCPVQRIPCCPATRFGALFVHKVPCVVICLFLKLSVRSSPKICRLQIFRWVRSTVLPTPSRDNVVSHLNERSTITCCINLFPPPSSRGTLFDLSLCHVP